MGTAWKILYLKRIYLDAVITIQLKCKLRLPLRNFGQNWWFYGEWEGRKNQINENIKVSRIRLPKIKFSFTLMPLKFTLLFFEWKLGTFWNHLSKKILQLLAVSWKVPTIFKHLQRYFFGSLFVGKKIVSFIWETNSNGWELDIITRIFRE